MRALIAFVAGPAVVATGLITAAAVISAPSATSASASPLAAGSSCRVTSDVGARSGVFEGVQLSSEQMHNAQIIVGVVSVRHLPSRAAEVAVMTAMQESSLIIIRHGDAAGPDSRGLFQQRASWGREADRLDPATATGLFLDRLVQITNWQSLPPELAAHEVQGNQRASDYVRWIPVAQSLTGALLGNAPSDVDCSGGTLFPGASSSAKAKVALTAAQSMLGKPYCWAGGDADGPTHGAGGDGCGGNTVGFDCSGLALFAWARAGVDLPHLAADQAQLGRRVPLAQAQPGDLVFLSDATSGIHHVAIIWSIATGSTTGAGQIIEAQDFNVPVHIRPWRGTAEPEVVPYAVRLGG